MTDWTTTDQVKAALGLDPADGVDDGWLEAVVSGVNQVVDDTRPPPATDPVTGQPIALPPNPRTSWGATQLATRWYSRRNSTEVSAFVELGGPPPSIDRDIEVALEIGRHFRPVVA
jgi:hypothetical protein